jgi:hypothetical protein
MTHNPDKHIFWTNRVTGRFFHFKMKIGAPAGGDFGQSADHWGVSPFGPVMYGGVCPNSNQTKSNPAAEVSMPFGIRALHVWLSEIGN